MTSQNASPTPPRSDAAEQAAARASDRPRPSAWYTRFGPQILIALVVGLALGLLARATGHTEDTPTWLGEGLATLGSSYISLLRATVVPLVFFAVVASIANLAQVTNAARLAAKTLLWFALTSLVSVLIGVAVGAVVQPGVGTGQQAPTDYTAREVGWLDFLKGLIPANFLGLEASASVAESGAVSVSPDFNVLQVLVVSIAVGVAALKVGAKAEPFLSFSRSVLAVIQKVLWWIIRLAPLGTVGLLGNAVASYGWTTMGTLPVTQRVAERNFGVPTGYASFAVPLGATTKMDGCASIYPAIAALFVAQFFGIDLSLGQYALIVLVSVLGSAATAGTTGATVMLTLTLSTAGLPLEGMALLLAVDPIVDMGRTATNVAGQALIPALVAKQEHILDLDRYNAERADIMEDEEEIVDARRHDDTRSTEHSLR
ncbi:dicarboxylate/amino acid:cation symporter [Micrococcus lylae]|uniref:dicarboxylate/amino acid:cation symporter n=1 Tax=Micrococcus lylae TaxID=1273 RepID=UPI0021A4FA9B|nr:dicarboxylate/amino acid:cation symporter [Micrococcus lylae]MCT2006701.1 dicarboxylate/amino acid:cation symporter [Micrococcus lylae]MCT2070583.1 dicarboxylate/amino acid:cation symporter [Micrococcus lylae]